MDVYLDGKRVRVQPSSSIGKGGEADVFDLGDGTVLKLFKAPDHPDYAGQPAEQQAARERLEVHQQKLRLLPRDLPAGVVAPIRIATDRGGRRVLGYTMRYVQGAEVLLRYAEPSLRRTGLSAAHAVSALAGLHRTVEALHARGIVIGDFNDLNVLVRDGRSFLVDADSMQFGGFLCRVYSERFLDPLLCDPSLTHPSPVRAYEPASDWYAFAVMLMQSLVCVGPHGGVYRPKDPAARIPQAARPLERITVFHPEVQYPRPAIPLSVLPDELLEELSQIFVHDRRGPFPRRLVDDLRWTRCAACGAEHARAVCPGCVLTAKAAVKETTVARGRVTATRIFASRGIIVCAALQDGALRWLSYEGGRYLREDGTEVLAGSLDPALAFAIHGRTTLVGRGAEAVALAPGRAPERLAVDVFQGRPAIAANARRRYWTHGGVLYRSGVTAIASTSSVAARVEQGTAARIGDVLGGQTRFWVGDRFGLGFYRAGTISVAFVFDAERGGLVDTLKLPFLPGEIFDADCVMDDARAFMLLAARHRGRTVHQCVAVSAAGAVEAAAEAPADDGSWLGTLRGKCAAGGLLLAASESGIRRVEVRGGSLVETRHFPDTEPFVDASTRLFAGPGGLFAVGDDEIHTLRIA
jgi:tRNA A-37 threonylcarbamoyl transferase component Bud32